MAVPWSKGRQPTVSFVSRKGEVPYTVLAFCIPTQITLNVFESLNCLTSVLGPTFEKTQWTLLFSRIQSTPFSISRRSLDDLFLPPRPSLYVSSTLTSRRPSSHPSCLRGGVGIVVSTGRGPVGAD